MDLLLKSQRKHGEDFLSVEVLDRSRRCEILTSVYIVRSDTCPATPATPWQEGAMSKWMAGDTTEVTS